MRRNAVLISMLIWSLLRLIYQQSRLISGLSSWLQLTIAVQYLAFAHSPIQIDELHMSLGFGRVL